MTVKYHAAMSENSKTGRMLVTTSSKETCPNECKHKQLGTCYANFSFIGLHWRKVSDGSRNIGFGNVLEMVRRLPEGAIWRWGQAGDLPGVGSVINEKLLHKIVLANSNKQGYAYTHKPLTVKNIAHLLYANKHGFTVNVSADSIEDAVLAYNTGLPTVVTVPHDTPDTAQEYKGIWFVMCPNQRANNELQCVTCKLCAIPTRKSIVMFKMHGSRRMQWEE